MTVSYKVAAENEIGMESSCTPAASIPITWQERTASPWTPMAVARFLAIGGVPVVALGCITFRFRKK